jgi:hypothetical protein
MVRGGAGLLLSWASIIFSTLSKGPFSGKEMGCPGAPPAGQSPCHFRVSLCLITALCCPLCFCTEGSLLKVHIAGSGPCQAECQRNSPQS